LGVGAVGVGEAVAAGGSVGEVFVDGGRVFTGLSEVPIRVAAAAAAAAALATDLGVWTGGSTFSFCAWVESVCALVAVVAVAAAAVAPEDGRIVPAVVGWAVDPGDRCGGA